MSNNHPDSSKVQALWKVAVIERGLQNASGEHDLVLISAVVRVHYGRGGVPLGFINRLTEPAKLKITKHLPVAILNFLTVATSNNGPC